MKMQGQSLVEVVIALSVIAIVVTGIATTVTTALSNNQFTQLQSLATDYSEEGMEIVREIRNSDYEEFATKSGAFCIGEDNRLQAGECSGENIEGVFMRSVGVEQSPACAVDVSRVTVTTAYTSGKCRPQGALCHESKLVTCMSVVNPIKQL